MSSRGHHLAMLVGNGLSIAFSNQLFLQNISRDMLSRFSSNYTGSDEVALAMQKVASHRLTGNPAEDFEKLIGAFGGQSDVLDDLADFANLTTGAGTPVGDAIATVRSFVQSVRRQGIGHTLQIIMERTYSDWSRQERLHLLFDTILEAFAEHVTIANLNYDTLVLAALMDKYQTQMCDMARGGPGGTVRSGGVDFAMRPLRPNGADFMSYSDRRIRLLHLHGSLTYWRIEKSFRKIPVEALRYSTIWDQYRNDSSFDAEPLVVLANQDDKAEHVARYPFNVAYSVAEAGMVDADHWLIMGYSFRDECVNDLLARALTARTAPTKILVVTHGPSLHESEVIAALGPSFRSLTHTLEICRSGAFNVPHAAEWGNFTSDL